jgi:2-oxoglutarate ferredoxin oxidoreductase subunit gamma
MSRFEVRYGAIGGQGIITAATLLVAIAVEKENKHAVESPTITAAVRGGATKADVIISDNQIIYPQAMAIDFFVCTHRKPYALYTDKIRDDAIVVIDSNLVFDKGDTKNWDVHDIPIIHETKDKLGRLVLTSVVTLSITQALTEIIEYDNMVSYVREWAPKDFLELNMEAIDLGQDLAK